MPVQVNQILPGDIVQRRAFHLTVLLWMSWSTRSVPFIEKS